MIRSSANLESDDIHVRCRVRRSPYASNPEFDQGQEMNCIMRNWQPVVVRSRPQRTRAVSITNAPSNPSSSSSTFIQRTEEKMVPDDVAAHHQGPELILQPVLLPTLSNSLNMVGGDGQRQVGSNRYRFHSFASAASLPQQQTPSRRASEPVLFSTNYSTSSVSLWNDEQQRRRPENHNNNDDDDNTFELSETTTILLPLSDIIVCDVDNHGRRLLLYLTTQHNGYMEFCFLTVNARDMMVAFLSATLPKERIVTSSSVTNTTPLLMQMEPAAQSSGGGDNSYCWQPQQRGDDAAICTIDGMLDVETLTANRIEEEANRHESFTEKFRQRVAYVAFQLQEMSTAFSECACGGLTSTTTTIGSIPGAPTSMQKQDVADEDQNGSNGSGERRQSPPRRSLVPDDMEIAYSIDEVTVASSSVVKNKKNASAATVVKDSTVEPEMKSKHS